jgi:hypothetical protein
MKTKSCLIVSAMSLILFSCANVSTAQTDEKKIVRRVTAAQVNGVYRFYKSTFRVLALGNNKLKVQFAGVYENIMKNVNVGYTEGIATIEGNVATLVPEGTTGCKFTMTFLPGKLVVKQEGADYECGFGHNVYATGTYKKIRSGKPKFQPPP